MSALEKLRKQLIIDEGIRLKPYMDSKGIISLGVGRNLEDRGITYDEAMYLLTNDMAVAAKDAAKFKWFTYLDEDRQVVILNMIFNLGLPRFMQFKKFIQAMEWQNYAEAYKEMLDSRWAKEVGDRAVRLAKIIRDGH